MRESYSSRPAGTTALFALAAVLLLGCGRVVHLLHSEIEARASSNGLRSQLPPDNSLWGVGKGRGGRAVIKFGGGPDSNSRLLLFVIHAREERSDVRFWNQTVRLVLDAPGGNRIGFWGICDDGAACKTDRHSAEFAILGYLDPYEMRMMALADTRKEALLYRGPTLSGLSVPIQGTPRTQALAILREAE